MLERGTPKPGSIEGINKPELVVSQSERRPAAHLLEDVYSDVLSGEDFEETAEAYDVVHAVWRFREKTFHLPFSSFWDVVEEVTNIDGANLKLEQKQQKMERVFRAMENNVSRFSPRVADLYFGFLSYLKGEDYEPRFDITRQKLAQLAEKSDMEVLFSADVSWDLKLNRIENMLVEYLRSARAFDHRDGKDMADDVREWRQKQLKKAPSNPPNSRRESKPGVDAMSRLKEGEKTPAIWTISPAYGGYYKSNSFSIWDSKRNVWTSEEPTYRDVIPVSLCKNEDINKGLINLTMTAQVQTGSWVELSVPYTHALHKVDVKKSHQVKQDQNGNLVIFVEGDGDLVDLSIILAPDISKKFTSNPKDVHVPQMPSTFLEDTLKKLEEIKSQKTSNLERAHAISSFIKKTVKYLAPKDEDEANRYNDIYNSHQGGFAGAVDEIKEGDCDVVNTYFSALCAKLNIPTRHVVGHMVKSKDERGNAVINSGTGHGWTEVWDNSENTWVRIDATPPGDSQMEDEKETKKEKDDFMPGDFSIQESVAASYEKLRELEQSLKTHKEKLSYTREERSLSQLANIELKEARQIIQEINKAESTKLHDGERVVDVLAKLFNAIIESRKTNVIAYDGPVRQREGGERISHLVRHAIGIKAGDLDPISREKSVEETELEENFGGLDVYLIGDKSGSTSSTMNGESIWSIQRRAEYLVFSALHSFQRNLERAHLPEEDDLVVRTQGISFGGSSTSSSDKIKTILDLDKPLSSNFSALDKVKMWHSLTGAGGGNNDVVALSHVYEQIKEEVAQEKTKGKEKKRLRIVMACSDGGYNDQEAIMMQFISQKMYEELGIIVVGLGLTENAKQVPIVMNNPPFSKGDLIKNVSDLPFFIAKHLILEIIKLFPDRAKGDAQKLVQTFINKFRRF